MSESGADYRGDVARLKAALINVVRAQILVRDALITISNETKKYEAMVTLIQRVDEIGDAISAALTDLDHA